MDASMERRTPDNERDVRINDTKDTTAAPESNELNDYLRKPIRQRTKALFDKFR